MSKKISMSRIRREIKKSEMRVAERASADFRRFVNLLPWWARLKLAWKMMKGAL